MHSMRSSSRCCNFVFFLVSFAIIAKITRSNDKFIRYSISKRYNFYPLPVIDKYDSMSSTENGLKVGEGVVLPL